VPHARQAPAGRPLPGAVRTALGSAFGGTSVSAHPASGRWSVSGAGDPAEREAATVAGAVTAGRQTRASTAAADFSTVRLHTGPAAAASARARGAAAYTVGEDVVLGEGATGTDPRSTALLAHELTHVLQQRRSGSRLVQRQALPGTAPTPPALQLPAGGGLAAGKAVMRAVDGLSPMPDGRFTTTYEGRQLVLTADQAARARATARTAVADVLSRSWHRYDQAVGRYASQKSVDREFWFTSRAAHAFAWARTLGDHADPGTALALQRPVLTLSDGEARRALGEGRLEAAAEAAARAEVAAGRSAALVRAFVDQTIEGAESLATGLEYTRDAAFITLGVLAVVASGGAAAGLAPEVVGAGIGGLSVGTTATVISVGAPIVANVGVGVAKTVAGDPVDWGAIAVDAAVQVVLARFGGKLGEGIFARLAGNPVARSVARKALASVLSGVLTHEAGQAFSTTVHTTYTALRGRPVSWSQFLDELATRMADPKGIFIAAAMSGFQVAAHGAVEKAASGRPAATPVTEATMLAQRRQQNVDALADVPQLQAAVMAGRNEPGPGNLADIPPASLRPTWEAYLKNSSARVAKGEQPHDFATYVKTQQASEARAVFGETTDAFNRARSELIVQAPGRVNEGGIDSVSLAPGPGGGRVKLLDNKAYGKNVGKVSALQENLAQNLTESIGIVRDATQVPGAPPELGTVVLPRLRAASQAVEAHITAWSKANPGGRLDNPKLQADLGRILDQHGIDRVVTTAGGKPGVTITKGLRNQGFTHE